jgi:NTE family protein
MTAVRASSGMPGLFAPTWHAGRWLIDGGVVNPVPVSMCRALGADIVIAVDLSRSVTHVAKRALERIGAATDNGGGANSTPHVAAETTASDEGIAILKKWSGLVDGLVESFRSKRTEPGLLEVMGGSVNIMQDRITRSRLAIDPADLVLHPDLTDFQLMDFHRAREAIAAGRAYVEQSAALLEPTAARLRTGVWP